MTPSLLSPETLTESAVYEGEIPKGHDQLVGEIIQASYDKFTVSDIPKTRNKT
jgi:hypothetical protein